MFEMVNFRRFWEKMMLLLLDRGHKWIVDTSHRISSPLMLSPVEV